MPQAPTPPIKDIVITSEDPELIEILKEIKQTLDIREGRLGDTNFRFIDYYELLELLSGDETITITVLPGAHSHQHNDLTTIQGGTTDEYYHLTLAQHTALGTHPDHNDLAAIQGGSASERYHLTAAQHGNLHAPNIIEQLNSKVEVIDAGAGEVSAVVDGTEYLELIAGRSILGNKAGGLGYIEINEASDGSVILKVDDTSLEVSEDPGKIIALIDTETYLFMDADKVRIGRQFPTDTYIEIHNADDHIKFFVDAGGLVFTLLTDRAQLPVGLLETNTSTPIDLEINCGTQKTLKLTEGVWKDINVGGAQLNPIPAFAPDLDTFADEGGTDTGIYTLAFAVNESASGSFELQHDYKEGTDVSFHIHWQGKAAPSGTDNVRWELTYVFTRDGQTLDAPVTLAVETPIDTQYIITRSTFPTISGSTGGNNGSPLQIPDQMLIKVERVAAVGDAYLGDALVCTAGLHYQVDTLGSRQIGSK